MMPLIRLGNRLQQVFFSLAVVVRLKMTFGFEAIQIALQAPRANMRRGPGSELHRPPERAEDPEHFFCGRQRLFHPTAGQLFHSMDSIGWLGPGL